jgi:carbohydrate diacid regulator
MEISRQVAMNIVTEINGIIGEDINIMNPDGIIIASTNARRIGTFHAGAKKVIDENLDELVISYDGEYEGSYSGTNIPIKFKETIAGVIGVTGPGNEVVKYGKIIKKMSEILIAEQYYSQQQEIDQRIRDRFLTDWIAGGTMSHLHEPMVERGNILGIDITKKRRIMILSVASLNEQGLKDIASIDEAEAFLMRLLDKDCSIEVLQSGRYIIAALLDRDDVHMRNFAEFAKTEAEKSYPVKLAIGIDSGSEGSHLISHSCQKALKSIRTCLRSRTTEIRFYSSINMEIFISELTPATKREYIRSIFKGLGEEETGEWISLLEVFYDAEGSLTETANKLFIHKNTLQYKLRKLDSITGYDPRSLKFSSLYYNAIHFYQDLLMN